jgi:hypothetical protein
MHFVKTIVSLFALSSFAAAQVHGEELEAALAARDVAYEDLLFARDEYIEKRELFKRLSFPYSLDSGVVSSLTRMALSFPAPVPAKVWVFPARRPSPSATTGTTAPAVIAVRLLSAVRAAFASGKQLAPGTAVGSYQQLLA